MKKRGKKLLSYLLALVLVLGIVPWISLTAKAGEPIVIIITGATAEDRTYEPGKTSVEIKAVTFKKRDIYDPVTLVKDIDYTVTGTMLNDKAGSNKDVKVTVTLMKPELYTFYGWRNTDTATTTVNITEATPPTGDFDFTEPTGPVDMFRLYNPNSGEHFYTGNEGEKDHLVSLGWNFEGIAWTAPAESKDPVYRLYNPNAGDHHYTMSEAEKDWLVGLGWNDEGIGWYSVVTEREPIYRLYNPNATTGTHHFTASEGERDYLISLGWRDEGIGWYGLGEDAA